MKARELFELKQDKPVVMFNKNIDNYDHIEFDQHMKARLIDMKEDGEFYLLMFGFWEFAEYNKQFEVPNFNDSNLEPTLKWSETTNYSPHSLIRIYVDYDQEINFLQICPDDFTVPEEVEALSWVVDQFEKVLQGKKAANVEECLLHAHSILAKYDK